MLKWNTLTFRTTQTPEQTPGQGRGQGHRRQRPFHHTCAAHSAKRCGALKRNLLYLPQLLHNRVRIHLQRQLRLWYPNRDRSSLLRLSARRLRRPRSCLEFRRRVRRRQRVRISKRRGTDIESVRHVRTPRTKSVSNIPAIPTRSPAPTSVSTWPRQHPHERGSGPAPRPAVEAVPPLAPVLRTHGAPMAHRSRVLPRLYL